MAVKLLEIKKESCTMMVPGHAADRQEIYRRSQLGGMVGE